MLITEITDCVSMVGNAITSVHLSVCLSVSPFNLRLHVWVVCVLFVEFLVIDDETSL